jgi:uncharacterized protein (DUF1330 family)
MRNGSDDVASRYGEGSSSGSGTDGRRESESTYVIAHLEARMGEELVSYLHDIDATLEPFGGRYLIHGGAVTALEESWSGDLIVIGFPDRASALGWYESPAYRMIRPLRTRNATGPVILVGGVAAGHRATDLLAAGLRRDAGRKGLALDTDTIQ